MKDEILENVWKAKEAVSREAPEGFEMLAAYIKSEAKKISLTHPTFKNASYVMPNSEIMACHEERED